MKQFILIGPPLFGNSQDRQRACFFFSWTYCIIHFFSFFFQCREKNRKDEPYKK